MKKFPIWIVNSLEYNEEGEPVGEVLALFTQDGEAEEYIKPLKDECYAVWIEKHEVPESFFVTKNLVGIANGPPLNLSVDDGISLW